MKAFTMEYYPDTESYNISEIPDVVLDITIGALLENPLTKWIGELLSDEQATAVAEKEPHTEKVEVKAKRIPKKYNITFYAKIGEKIQKVCDYYSSSMLDINSKMFTVFKDRSDVIKAELFEYDLTEQEYMHIKTIKNDNSTK